MFILVPAHPGCPGQNLESCTMVVVVLLLVVLCTVKHILKYYTVINQPDKNSKSMPDFQLDASCRTLVCEILRHDLCCKALQKTSAAIYCQDINMLKGMHKIRQLTRIIKIIAIIK